VSDPPINDCGGAVAVANIGYTEVAERIRPTEPRWQIATNTYIDVSFLHQLDRQAIQHLLRLTAGTTVPHPTANFIVPPLSIHYLVDISLYFPAAKMTNIGDHDSTRRRGIEVPSDLGGTS
jgi:hypothetical protein